MTGMHTMPRLCAVLMLAGALSACNRPTDDSYAQEVQLRLMGTWLRAYEENGARVRRVLVLAQDGLFSETSKATQHDAILAEHSHTGNWHFDGTNLKGSADLFSAVRDHLGWGPLDLLKFKLGRENTQKQSEISDYDHRVLGAYYENRFCGTRGHGAADRAAAAGERA